MIFAALAFLIFVSLVLASYALMGMLGARHEARQTIERRLASLSGAADAGRGRVLKDRRLSSIAPMNDLLSRLRFVRAVTRAVAHAGLKKRVGEVLLYVPLASGVAFMITTVMTGEIALGAVAAIVASVLPMLVVRRMARKRAAAFADQLPDALDLVRAALQAGHGLMAAMSVVAEEFPDPIAQELRDLTEEVRLGRPMREALDNLAERVGNDDVALLSVGILTAQDIGGNLAEVLDKISYTIRERFKLQREVQVLTAQGRMSGGVLTALPFLAGFAMMLFSPGYFTPMLHTETGHYLLAYAVGSVLVGHLMISRIVRIQV